MKFTEKQQKLLEFVKGKHGDQKRKYTGEPYWTHLVGVAEIVAPYSILGFSWCMIEVALCHDLLEDTDCSMKELQIILSKIHYTNYQSMVIISGVSALTDDYTKFTYPELNRKERKSLECERLSHILPYAQTVKYADLIHNTQSIVAHDPKFAKVYLKEKEDILKVMNDGHPGLYKRCKKVLADAKEALSKTITNQSYE
jgi:(p)ppGpp synthase/HD superfamily hydrolase